MVFVAYPVAVGNPGAARDGDDVGAGRSRGLLLAGDLIDAVVHDHDGEVARLDHPDGGQASQRHQNRAVAFERDHAALALDPRNPQNTLTTETHPTNPTE